MSLDEWMTEQGQIRMVKGQKLFRAMKDRKLGISHEYPHPEETWHIKKKKNKDIHRNICRIFPVTHIVHVTLIMWQQFYEFSKFCIINKVTEKSVFIYLVTSFI